jgi:hypothetical protein
VQPIPLDNSGRPIFPIELGHLTVYCLGDVSRNTLMLFTHSRTHALTHTHALNSHTCTHSLTHSLARSLARTHARTHALIHSLTHSLTCYVYQGDVGRTNIRTFPHAYIYLMLQVTTDRPGFHTVEHIFPAGFYSTRVYQSIDPRHDTCLYNCKIVDAGGSGPKVGCIVLCGGGENRPYQKLFVTSGQVG